SGAINVTIELPNDASAGDILTVNGAPHTLTAAEILAEEHTTTFTSPGEGSTLTVTATITNGVGNTSASASDAANIETTLPDAPTVVITEDTNNDGTINSSELSGAINVTISLPNDASA
ncbi:hypothetical protein MWU65_17620, partial [Cellulophaga sp. F20128]|uniref:hypothetical protein n=1 Tax=Cellulophaga sp. F20128 TaxID=2926413 RepID=UPI001FF18572